MATKLNLVIDQGADYTKTFTVVDANNDPLDLTGYSGEAQIRKYYSSSTKYDFEVSLGGNTGQVTLSLNANTSGNIEAGKYLYDVELTDDSNTITRVREGLVTINGGVTK